MVTSSPRSSHSRPPRGTSVHKRHESVNGPGHLSANSVVGWLAHAHRLTQLDCADTSIATLAGRSSGRISKSMISMLENGQRGWTTDTMTLIEELLDLEGHPLQRTYLAFGGYLNLAELSSQTTADHLDEIIGGNIDRIPPLDVLRAIQWATNRKEPLGRRSWREIVVNYIDRTCDTKGIYSKECDQALPNLAKHSVANEHYLEYTRQLATQPGHPKPFVPITAMQAKGVHIETEIEEHTSELQSR